MALDLFDQLEGGSSQKKALAKGKHGGQNGDLLSFNELFAVKYEEKKKGEELSKLKDKYGADYDESSEDSEDLSSEDSDAEFATPAVDAAILNTLLKIKTKDPSIYQSTAKIFDDEEIRHTTAKTNGKASADGKATKPVLLRDLQRQALISEATADTAKPGSAVIPTPVEAEAALRAETKRAFLGSDDEDNGDLLVPRELTMAEVEADEDAYKTFLRDNVGPAGIAKAFQLNSTRQDKSSGSGLPEDVDDDSFLKDYILDRGWLDKDAKKVPKYAEIVHETDQGRTGDGQAGGPSGVNGLTLWDDDEDDEHFEQSEAFESKYNFRFEDENANELITYARDTGVSARRPDDSRKQSRQALKLRKQSEKQAKVDELERLKDLKRNEIMQKLVKIRKNAGDQDFNVEGFDFESDFDPEEHDKRMATAFDDQFYSRKDADGKPIWDDEDEDFIGGQNNEEETMNMDADFEPGGDAYDPTGKTSKRQKQRDKKKRKKRKLIDETLQPSQSQVDDNEDGMSMEDRKRKLNQAVEEYEKLGFEDVIGDLPTRFKYAEIEPDTFSLTPTEILLATDTELNDYLGLRNIAPYRFDQRASQHCSKVEAKRMKKVKGMREKKLKDLRLKLQGREWGKDDADEGGQVEQGRKKRVKVGEDGDEGKKVTKRLGRKERQQRAKANGTTLNEQTKTVQ